MRRRYLVTYDIADQKRLRKVFRIMKGYGEPWQYSVFYCTLKDIDLVRLERELNEVMNISQDQTLIIELGLDNGDDASPAKVLGRSLPEQPERIIVI